MKLKYFLILLLILLIEPLAAQTTPFNSGVNLSGWFQRGSAQEIQFNQYTRRDFEQIKNLGADVIRLPINLHFMTSGAPDYKLDPLFLSFLDQVVGWAEELNIHLILDNHTFDPATSTDPNIGPVLEAVWLQMAEHYEDRSNFIYYEVMNEPHGISDEAWNSIQQDVVTAIRTVDEKHTIIIGGANWNSYTSLAAMPVYDDDNLIYTFHFYDPMLFTHQGASWVDPSMEPLAGVPFPYRAEDMPAMPASFENTWLENQYNNYSNDGTMARVQASLDIAIQFREERKVPIYLGELGVLMNNSDSADRTFWYEVVRQYLEQHNVSWTAWDYHGGFGVFLPGSNGLFDHDLNLPLLEALDFVEQPQTPFSQQTDNVGFTLYSDAVASTMRQSGSVSGKLEFYSQDRPYDGNYAIHWTNSPKYNGINLNFHPDKDLSFLASQGYALDFMVRGDTPGVSLNVRFVDTNTQDPTDRPWRMQVTIDDTNVSWDGQWHQVQIPLADFTDLGAWEDGVWYPSEGLFDWRVVDRFEIVNDVADLQGVNLWFDNIQLTRPSESQLHLSNDNAVNGLFFDPQKPGHGFDINLHQAGLTIYYYGHTDSGERLWLISELYTGDIEFNTPLALKFYEVTNGMFGTPEPPETEWGIITISLSHCNTGQADLNGLDGSFTMNLTRAAGTRGFSCSLATTGLE